MVCVHRVLFLLVAAWVAVLPALAEEGFVDPSRPNTTPPAPPGPVHVDLFDHLRVAPRKNGPEPDYRSYERMQVAVDELLEELADAEAKGDAPRQAGILGSLGTLYMLLGKDGESLDALYRGAALYMMQGNAQKLGELQTLIDLVSARSNAR